MCRFLKWLLQTESVAEHIVNLGFAPLPSAALVQVDYALWKPWIDPQNWERGETE